MENFVLTLDLKLYEQMKDMRLLLKIKQVMQNLNIKMVLKLEG